MNLNPRFKQVVINLITLKTWNHKCSVRKLHDFIRNLNLKEKTELLDLKLQQCSTLHRSVYVTSAYNQHKELIQQLLLW